MSVVQLHESYENCPMYLLSFVDDEKELDITQYHNYDEMMRDVELLGLTYYCIEDLFDEQIV